MVHLVCAGASGIQDLQAKELTKADISDALQRERNLEVRLAQAAFLQMVGHVGSQTKHWWVGCGWLLFIIVRCKARTST